VGAVVNSVAGEEIGKVAAPVVTDTVVQIVNGVFQPEAIPIALLAAYLRDKEAKHEENGGT